MSKHIIVRDNEGKTADPYTVIVPDGSVFVMSYNEGPQSVNQFCGIINDFPKGLKHTGKGLGNNIPARVISGLLARGYSLDELVNWTVGKTRHVILKALGYQ